MYFKWCQVDERQDCKLTANSHRKTVETSDMGIERDGFETRWRKEKNCLFGRVPPRFTPEINYATFSQKTVLSPFVESADRRIGPPAGEGFTRHPRTAEPLFTTRRNVVWYILYSIERETAFGHP